MAIDVHSLTENVIETLGGQAALGRALGVKQQVVGYWANKKKCFPAEHVLHIESLLRECGGGADRYDLRPDVYGERPVSEFENAMKASA